MAFTLGVGEMAQDWVLFKWLKEKQKLQHPWSNSIPGELEDQMIHFATFICSRNKNFPFTLLQIHSTSKLSADT